MDQNEILELKERLSRLSDPSEDGTENNDSFRYCAPELWKIYDGTGKSGNQIYRSFTDAELLSKLTEAASRLGRAPKQSEIYCVYKHYIRLRFGNWPKALEAAGLRIPKKLRRQNGSSKLVKTREGER